MELLEDDRPISLLNLSFRLVWSTHALHREFLLEIIDMKVLYVRSNMQTRPHDGEPIQQRNHKIPKRVKRLFKMEHFN